MMRHAIAALLICGVVTGANVSRAAAASLKLIYKVDSVAASVHGNKLTIIAAGAVSTGGWGKARLRLKPGHKPETDTLEFEFVAAPPPANEAVIQALVPVGITLATKLPPYGVTQIKVDAESNTFAARITR